MQVPEILSPAGDMERLEYAIRYGADAVYCSGTAFGMRQACANFSREDLSAGTKKAHDAGKKIYVTCNVLPRNKDFDELPEYLAYLDSIGVDALIISDLGTLELAKKYAPHCALHISTQFGVVNFATACALHDMGASRVVLARELSMEEIREIRAKTPSQLELEAFVHGSICMSFSGRCVISNYLTGRDANHGECAQPCRWKYSICEETRPDQPMTLEEDETGTYLFNANDMNMIDHVAELALAGVSSFKIEGRAKSFYYTAVTANAYKMAVKEWENTGFSAEFVPSSWISEELEHVSHRPYGTGFYYGMPSQHLTEGGYIRAHEVAAVVEGWDEEKRELLTTQRNRFFATEELNVLIPGEKPFAFTPKALYNEDHEPLEVANHAMMPVRIPFDRPLPAGSMLRRAK